MNDAIVISPAAGSTGAVLDVLARAGEIIVGKEQAIKLAMTCLIAGGHLLIEDLPGVGKTTLAHTLAQLLGLRFQRIQFTSDMLPADIIGVSVYDRRESGFRFHPGPVFTQVLLADEINRATPKTQGALLEAMEERQVTAEGETRRLPEPFFVIATQNPSSQLGTFALPESQLDRFLMRIELGYPDARAERALLAGRSRRELLSGLRAVMDTESLLRLQHDARAIRVSDALIDYVQALVAHTRTVKDCVHGLSPRAALGLVAAARAWALLAGRGFVVPEDVQAVFPSVAAHRLQASAELAGLTHVERTKRLLQAVPIP